MAERENSIDAGPQPHSDAPAPKLSELLDRGWRIFEDVDGSDEPLNSSSVQLKVARGIGLLEEASRMAAQLELFSRNEELDEVATADLKFLLCPALLGALSMKRSGRERRRDALLAARAYFMDFLRRCKEYNVCRFQLPKSADEDDGEASAEERPAAAKPVSAPSDLVAMAAQRQAKIERYRQKKEVEARLAEVRRAVDGGQADDEVSREFYVLSVRRWVTVSLDELDSIDQELQILRRMDGLQQGAAAAPPPAARPPMKPFILTKDAVQAQVFGAGYPSLPTMTVDDWYEQHRKRGALPDQGIPPRVADDDPDAKEREEEEKEKKVEEDEEESLRKARDWDDWKDSHRRGYGNRQNMG